MMTDSRSNTDKQETPEDVASLYSWANLHGARYRDFSASRAQTREKARLRVQEAIEEERLRSQEEAERKRQEEVIRQREAAEAERYRAQQPMSEEDEPGVDWRMHPAAGEPRTAPPIFRQAPNEVAENTAQVPRFRQDPPAGLREADAGSTQGSWASAPGAEHYGVPAWLAEDRRQTRSAHLPPAPEDTLQGSRDRLTTRWYALKSVFEVPGAAQDAPPVQSGWRTPVLAVFSLAGGVGKTSLAATLGRALSARGERVLLVDTSSYSLLPFYFGANDQRHGVVRTFNPPGGSGDAPLQMLALDVDAPGPDSANPDGLAQQIQRGAANCSRVIVDLATASGATTRRVLRLSPTVVVPVVPDLNSVVSVGSIDAFFQHHGNGAGGRVTPLYVLNQFDGSLPLHLDVREVLREQLGDRLLPVVLRRSTAVSEALAEGMTVMDYAPNSSVAEDFGALAGWVRSLAAPASANYRGVRWSER